jgi:hypothetical protein
MPNLNMANPDVIELQPALVIVLRDGFTGTTSLAGEITIIAGQSTPLIPDPAEAAFAFLKLPNGTYAVSVRSTADEPYYLPANFTVTLPFLRPAKSLWPQPPVWPGYPDLVVADPNKLLNDPEQTPEYLAQLEQTTLLPTTSYPFPANATLVRGTVTGAGVALSGALVTSDLVAQAGVFQVTVVNPSGPSSAATNLTVVATPVIESLEPSSVIEGSAGFVLSVTGSGFDAGSVIKLNGTALTTTTMSPSFLTAPVTAAQVAVTGQQTVVVANPDGTVSNQQTLTIAQAPVITSLSPASVATGSAAFTLTVEGTGFGPTAAIEVNTVPIPTSSVTSTSMSGVVPASQLAAAGQLSVLVTPGGAGQNSNAQALSVVTTPVITALEPSSVIAASPAFTLTVQGSGFVSGAAVNVNGAAAPTTFISATQLLAQITAAQVANAAQLTIGVKRPDNTASNSLALTVAAAPANTSIAPATVTADSTAFTIVVYGSGFMPGAVVQLNGQALKTTVVDSGQLYAIVPRSGYTTGADGTFVLFFDDISGLSQVMTLTFTHPSYPQAKSLDVTVLRGATVSVAIDMSS